MPFPVRYAQGRSPGYGATSAARPVLRRSCRISGHGEVASAERAAGALATSAAAAARTASSRDARGPRATAIYRTRFTPNPPSRDTAPRYPPISDRSRRPRTAPPFPRRVLYSSAHRCAERTPTRAHMRRRGGVLALVRAMHRRTAMVTSSPAGIVASLAILSSTIVVAVLLLGLVEEGVVAALRRRVARISRRAQGRRVVGVLEPVRTDPPASARVA